MENDIVLRKAVLADLECHRSNFLTECDYQAAVDVVTHTWSKEKLEQRAAERKQFYQEHPAELEKLRKLGAKFISE